MSTWKHLTAWMAIPNVGEDALPHVDVHPQTLGKCACTDTGGKIPHSQVTSRAFEPALIPRRQL